MPALKAKRLVPQRACAVKILARGTLDKLFTGCRCVFGGHREKERSDRRQSNLRKVTPIPAENHRFLIKNGAHAPFFISYEKIAVWQVGLLPQITSRLVIF